MTPSRHLWVRLRILSQSRTGWAILLAVLACMAWSPRFVEDTLAQPGPWTEPVNVSRSGAASQPAIAVASDGMLHVLWWDSVEGEQYSYTTGLTTTTWTKATSVPQVVGRRKVEPETNKVTLMAPLEVRMQPDSLGNIYAFWRDLDNQLLSARSQEAGWTGAVMLADSALGVDIAIDAKGALHLAYVRSLNSPGNPSGVYYRSVTGGADWSTPVLVYASPYFRSAKPEQVHVSVAGDGLGQVLVAWDDLETQRTLYARSADGGRVWSSPQLVTGNQADQVKGGYAASSPRGDFILLWQDAGSSGCGLSQRRSTDGGQSWSAPERILTDVLRCPGRWTFAPGGESPTAAEGKLWLLGMPPFDSHSVAGGLGVLAAWDGKAWSATAEVSLPVRDIASGGETSLGCLGLALTGKSAGIVGCDANGNIWAAHNAATLDKLISLLKPVWSMPEIISDRQAAAFVQGLPASVADDQGKLYSMWSVSTAENEPGAALHIAVWDNQRWSSPVRVLESPTGQGGTAGDWLAAKAEQPGAAIDQQGRLHVVWSGGTSGEVLYSWVYTRDALAPRGWAEPVRLPAPTRVGSWPDILADPRGDVLHVIYAVPYNEGRGIYYVRSNDGGATWRAPAMVFDAAANGWDGVDKPRLALDVKSNVLHATWLRSRLPGGAGAQAVMYARSTDGGQTWGAPFQVAQGAVDWPRVAAADPSQVHLVWNRLRGQNDGGYSLAEVWSQFSPDGGQRWSEPARVQALEEVSGPVGLAADEGGGLYLVGVGPGTSKQSVLLYSRWGGQAWTDAERSSLNQNDVAGNAATLVLLPQQGRLTAILREFVQASGSAGRFEIAATGRDIPLSAGANLNRQTAQVAPTFTPFPTSSPMPTATLYPTATPRPQLAASGQRGIERDPLQGRGPLLLGGALVAIIILIVIVGQVIRRREYR